MSLPPIDQDLKNLIDGYIVLESKCLPDLPFVLLTYAQSLDSRIALQRGKQTKISSIDTKVMTHYLRTKFDGILIGIGTFLCDNPGLTSRLESRNSQIRPIILDPGFKSKDVILTSKVANLAREGEGLGPYIIIDSLRTTGNDFKDIQRQLHEIGGKLVVLNGVGGALPWVQILKQIRNENINSLMVEGGAVVINELLNVKSKSSPLVDSLIVTIGSVYLGHDGVQVSPSSPQKLLDVKWWKGSEDTVLAARLTD